MGDHRCSIKIEMEFHGVRDELDGWYNWAPGFVYGVDDRVIDFIRRVYDRGMDAYRKIIEEAESDQHRAEIEMRERCELSRLKAKYESNSKQ